MIEFGKLPVVEDTEIVELFLDRARHAGELFQIVGYPARSGKALEATRLGRRRDFLASRRGRGADIDAGLALRTGNAVDCRSPDKPSERCAWRTR